MNTDKKKKLEKLEKEKQRVQATQLSLLNGDEVNTLALSGYFLFLFFFLLPAAKKQRADPTFFCVVVVPLGSAVYLHYRYSNVCTRLLI